MATLTSITAGYKYDNNGAVMETFAVNIPTGGTTVLNLPVLNLASGTHSLRFFTTSPNGSVDEVVTNDTISASFTVGNPAALPIVEQFSGTTFPPSGWMVANPNAGSTTWSRWSGVSPNGIPFSSPAAAWMDHYGYSGSLGHKDYLWTPPFDITSAQDSLIVTFQVAHREFNNQNDTLELVYSTNCGLSWQRFGGYYKWSSGNGANALATVTPGCPNCDFAPNSTSQWRRERIAIHPSAIGTPSSMMIGWKTINGFGNNIYIDDIIIDAKNLYTFIGSGNWTESSNWLNGRTPPSVLPPNHEIIINPISGNSVKDMPLILTEGSKLTVMPGKTLLVGQ
jgi:hypothetical protein